MRSTKNSSHFLKNKRHPFCGVPRFIRSSHSAGNPASAVAEESEEQGSECSFHLQVETKLSGLCELPRSPTQTSEAFAEESEEQGSGCSFHLQVETKLSGLCEIPRSPTQTSEAFAEERLELWSERAFGFSRKRRMRNQRQPQPGGQVTAALRKYPSGIFLA